MYLGFWAIAFCHWRFVLSSSSSLTQLFSRNQQEINKIRGRLSCLVSNLFGADDTTELKKSKLVCQIVTYRHCWVPFVCFRHGMDILVVFTFSKTLVCDWRTSYLFDVAVLA